MERIYHVEIMEFEPFSEWNKVIEFNDIEKALAYCKELDFQGHDFSLFACCDYSDENELQHKQTIIQIIYNVLQNYINNEEEFDRDTIIKEVLEILLYDENIVVRPQYVDNLLNDIII